jgi:hypothetical protein
VKRLGRRSSTNDPVDAMWEMGRQFVLGREHHQTMKRAAEWNGFTYSYVMLGEAARGPKKTPKQYHLSMVQRDLRRSCTHDTWPETVFPSN